MIKRLSVSNYRSLGENVTIELGRFTALVGPNGSGKSSILDALRFLADAMHLGLLGAVNARLNQTGPVLRWGGGHPRRLRIHLELDLAPGSQALYSLELLVGEDADYRIASEEAQIRSGQETAGYRIGNGRFLEGLAGITVPIDERTLALPILGGDARFQSLLEFLKQIAVYAISPESLRIPQRYSPFKPLDRHGSNWASILRDQPEEAWKPELVSALQQLTGNVEDIRISEAASYVAVEFLHRDSVSGRSQWFDAARESDGTLRMAGILTALLQEPPLPVVGIEEPELTVHPGAIPLLHDFLQQSSRRSQILVTTHSPELLDLVDVEDVRVVSRGPGGTTVAPMAREQKAAVRERLLTLGEVLRSEGLLQDRLGAA